MECPRCGNTKLYITDSRHVGSKEVTRIRRCDYVSETKKGCGLVFQTIEILNTVRVFNHRTLSFEEVDLKEYKQHHLEKELQGMSGFQPSLYRD